MQTPPAPTRVRPPTVPGRRTASRGTVWRPGLVSAGAATLANRAVPLTGSALGADMVVRPAARESRVAQAGTPGTLGLMHVITAVTWFLIVNRAAARRVI